MSGVAPNTRGGGGGVLVVGLVVTVLRHMDDKNAICTGVVIMRRTVWYIDVGNYCLVHVVCAISLRIISKPG